ncbi:MAG: site-specific integrase, partial [Solirubrobacterales bacterium]|nr:site-specific integrase [Solirubrobacterales bacterium]
MNPSAAIVIREHGGRPFYEAKFRYRGRQVKRRVGPAWLDREGATRDWRRRRGRVPEGWFDERAAHVAASQIVAAYSKDASEQERVERERRTRGVTFREVSHAYLDWLRDTKGAKPSTLSDYAYLLAETGVKAKRGKGKSNGHIMKALGDSAATKITTRDVELMLAAVAKSGVSARSVNKHRALASAIFNYGARDSTFGL